VESEASKEGMPLYLTSSDLSFSAGGGAGRKGSARMTGKRSTMTSITYAVQTWRFYRRQSSGRGVQREALKGMTCNGERLHEADEDVEYGNGVRGGEADTLRFPQDSITTKWQGKRQESRDKT